MHSLNCVLTVNNFTFSDCQSTDSGPNSPPTITTSGSPTSATIHEENEDPNYHSGRECINDLSLYTSPSMPNISLGRPHLPNAHSHTFVSKKNPCIICDEYIFVMSFDFSITPTFFESLGNSFSVSNTITNNACTTRTLFQWIW